MGDIGGGAVAISSPISSVMEFQYQPGPGFTWILDSANYPQTKAQAIKDLPNYPMCFWGIEQFLQHNGQSET